MFGGHDTGQAVKTAGQMFDEALPDCQHKVLSCNAFGLQITRTQDALSANQINNLSYFCTTHFILLYYDISVVARKYRYNVKLADEGTLRRKVGMVPVVVRFEKPRCAPASVRVAAFHACARATGWLIRQKWGYPTDKKSRRAP